MTLANDIKLTEYSHGAGCGCKIAPAVLDRILAQTKPGAFDPRLLVGNGERDDAAVVDLGDGTALVSTTDFFMPIVDDPLTFGRIAATNAISDVYAMGGEPLVAIAILGWPINQLPPEVAGQVVEGGRQVCTAAGCSLAGGHSIDAPEPIFGLAVTGRVPIDHLKRNGGAQVGDSIFLTKPLGVGILSTAQKKKLLKPEHEGLAVEQMLRLNSVGSQLARLPGVNAMTDVTGFGLLGHLTEMCAASETSAEIEMTQVPLIDAAVLDHYLEQGAVPGGTRRNWDSYGHHIAPLTDRSRNLLADPQTSGGLLLSVRPAEVLNVQEILKREELHAEPIGRMVDRADWLVEVKKS